MFTIIFYFLSSGKRLQEVVCVYSCLTLMIVNFLLILRHFRVETLSHVIFSAICGILTADFGSGVVHWAADTWGSVELPIVGKVRLSKNMIYFNKLKLIKIFVQSFLRPFREHHLDPSSITRHDWIETNGDNFMITLPILFKLTWIFITSDETEIKSEYPFCAYLFLCSIFVAITNQVS